MQVIGDVFVVRQDPKDDVDVFGVCRRVKEKLSILENYYCFHGVGGQKWKEAQFEKVFLFRKECV